MREILGTFTDPRWRLNNLYTVINKNAERVRFEENAIQARLNQSPAKRKMILKARQFGVSTNELLKMFDYTIWSENVTACILAHEDDAIEKLFRIIIRANKYLDPRLKPELDRGGGSKYELFFPEINSRIYCDLESRSDTIHWLHISEAAFVKDPNRIRATIEAVPLHGRVTLESTPNGMGNHFYDTWMNPKHPYAKLFFPWYLFSEYQIETLPLELTDEERKLKAYVLEQWKLELTDAQLAFRRFKQGENGLLFSQEYPEDDQSCFLSSGHAAMDLVLVKQLLDKAPNPVEIRGEIKIYEEPYAGGRYVVGADVAEGVRKDYSFASVIDARTMRQVATVRGHMKPTDFADCLVELCGIFTVRAQHPLLAVERNNHGHAVILKLDEILHYPNLYVAKDDRLGWLTDRVTRPLMVDTFIEGVEHRHLTVQDPDTLRECLTLVDNNGKIEGAEGKHDDCVMGSAITFQLAIAEAQTTSLYDNIGSKILT